jgi:hypothetical protein
MKPQTPHVQSVSFGLALSAFMGLQVARWQATGLPPKRVLHCLLSEWAMAIEVVMDQYPELKQAAAENVSQSDLQKCGEAFAAQLARLEKTELRVVKP